MLIMQLLKVLWVRWKAVAHTIATFQSRALLFIFYYVVLAPFALGMQLASDPLRLRRSAPGGWLPRPEPEGDITLSARRQF
jgi:hypothetical protein